MIDPTLAPPLLLVLLGAVLLLRDLSSTKNLGALFDLAEKLIERGEAAPIADDLGEIGRSALSPRLASQMARMALTGKLSQELRSPGARSRAFLTRWQGPNAEPSAMRTAVLRRFVWELTRASLVFGSALAVWLLWRLVRHGDHARDWAVLAAAGIGVRAVDRR